jgi:translation initiation factor 2 alpha subunit (eIF-2alpha)
MNDEYGELFKGFYTTIFDSGISDHLLDTEAEMDAWTESIVELADHHIRVVIDHLNNGVE